MNKSIMRAIGFNNAIDLIEECRCPFCKKPVIMSEFVDELSIKEFNISGICQKCQDSFFK